MGNPGEVRGTGISTRWNSEEGSGVVIQSLTFVIV